MSVRREWNFFPRVHAIPKWNDALWFVTLQKRRREDELIAEDMSGERA
jgi:hypothetical protein